ncbi:MAG: hypothetical protein JXA42_17455, partial [Anaerolineales bacterium]|nr:hypothetical protein [Anaerolineales bacterium]
MVKVAVIGSQLVDMSIRTARTPARGDNLRGRSFRMGAGGKGANAATAIVRLGGQALVVGCLGDDVLGHFQLAALQAEGIDTTGIRQIPDSPTSVAFVMVDDSGENTVLVANQTNLLLSNGDVNKALFPHWDSLDALLVNFEASEEAVRFAVEQGRAHGIPVIVDAG